MIYIGIDLSGPSNSKDTVLTAFKETEKGEIELFETLNGADDNDISSFLTTVRAEGEIVAGIDAPLSYNVGGGDRKSDSELRKELIAAGLKSGTVMTPTMTRMVYLTLRGISVARLFEAVCEKVTIAEVHPGGAMALRGAPVEDVRNFKKSEVSGKKLLKWMEFGGLKNITDMEKQSDHYVASCAAAFSVWKWYNGKAVWYYSAQKPIHPYEFVC